MDGVGTIVNIGLILTYILFIGAVLVTLGSAVYYIITHPEKAKGVLIGVGGITLILLLGFLFSGSEVTQVYADKGVTSGTSSKFIGGIIISMYILGLVAVVSIIYSEVIRIIK
ncbi:MAG: hypothetical protein ACJAZ3_001203 [Sphingobacteriales bacterium]|jgi:hypothetical protein